MFERFIIWIATILLKNKRISLEGRHLLTNAVLDKLAALPLHDIISVDANGALVINGKIIDREEIMLLRESAVSSLSNRSQRIIEDQVLFEAFTLGVNTSTNFEQLYFAKAAIWWGQRKEKYLNLLASFGKENNE